MAQVDHTAEAKRLGVVLKEKQESIDAFANFGVKTELGEGGEVKGLVISPEDAASAQTLIAERTALMNEIKMHEAEAGIRAFTDAVPTMTPASMAAAGWDSQELKSLGEKVLGAEGFLEWKEAGFRGKSINIDLPNTSFYLERKRMFPGGLERKDIYTALGGTQTVPAFGHSDDHGIVERVRRTARVRDLLQVGSTTANLIEFIRVTGFVNGAGPVTQRADVSGNAVADWGAGGGTQFMLKPTSDLEFTPDQTPVRLLAHTIRAHRTVLDDEPRLRAIIDTEMLYGLQIEEDAQLLTGDGTAGGLVGLLSTEGIQTYEQRTNDNTPTGTPTERKSEAVRRSLTLVLLAYYEATGVVVSPLDWEDIELEKDIQGRPILVTNIAIGAEKRLWRMPVTESVALAEGHFVTGAFGIAARVWDRMQASVDVSTEDQDNFVRNAVTIRAEERLALEVPRPEAIVHGRFYGQP